MKKNDIGVVFAYVCVFLVFTYSKRLYQRWNVFYRSYIIHNFSICYLTYLVLLFSARQVHAGFILIFDLDLTFFPYNHVNFDALNVDGPQKCSEFLAKALQKY